jgi:4-hydroxybenzoyl-CoA thioesterase/acyl-CoA thioester hydrolase
MEFAEVAFLRSLGLSVAMTWGEEHLGFPRVSATCDFLRPVSFEDVVDIDVRVERVGSKSVTYSFEFTHEGETVARGKVSAVCCRVRPGVHEIESVEIPDGIRTRLLEGNKAL